MPALLTSTETGADLALDCGSDGGAGRPIGDVEGERFGDAAGAADRRHGLRGGLAFDVECGDFGAFAGKTDRDGAADPGTGPGDDSDVVMEKPWHVFVPLSLQDYSLCGIVRAG